MFMEARHLRPHQKTEVVGPVQPARVLGLLGLASAVEAEGAGELDVPAQRFAIRGGEQAFGKVALVEDQALDKRLPVEQEAAVTHLNCSKSEIRLDAIAGHRALEVVQS